MAKRHRQYAALLACVLVTSAAVAFDLFARGTSRVPAEPERYVPEGNARLGRENIVAHGCGACHVIPGIRQATGRVGPQLVGLRDQIYLAGMLPNTPEDLVAWIRHPRRINPGTAMPDLGLSEAEARNVAAYLYEMK